MQKHGYISKYYAILKKHKKALEMKLRCFVKGGKEGCDLE